MPTYEGTDTVTIAAAPRACFDALTDYERLPGWQSRLRSCEVLSRDADGRGLEVEYEVDALVRRLRYRLRHVYDEPRLIDSEYLDGDFRHFEGRYGFEPEGEGTRATLEVRIDPGVWVPRTIAGRVHEALICGALGNLKAFVEAGGRAASRRAEGSRA